MSKSRGTPRKKFKFAGFENVEFSGDERQKVIDWIDANDFDLVDCITVLIEAEWKVGFGYDAYNQTNVVSLTCKDENSAYFGVCFMFKHSDVGRGIKIARFMYDFFLRDGLYEMNKKSDTNDW